MTVLPDLGHVSALLSSLSRICTQDLGRLRADSCPHAATSKCRCTLRNRRLANLNPSSCLLAAKASLEVWSSHSHTPDEDAGIVQFPHPPLQKSAAEISEIPKMPADPTCAEARSRICVPCSLPLQSCRYITAQPSILLTSSPAVLYLFICDHRVA